MVHDAAATGFQLRSDTYVKARPSYHREVIDEVVRALGNDRTGAVVDLGAGTGIATAALIERGVDVLAVEPVEAMRNTLRANATAATVVDGTAESIPLDDGAADAVVAAQSFHWFEHASALAEIGRVLRPGGCLVTLWNVRDETVPWMAAYTAIQDRYQGDTPRYRHMTWRRSIEDDERFRLENEIRRPNPQRSDPQHTIDRLMSTSFIAALDAPTQQQIASEVREIVADLGGRYDFPYSSEAQVWRYRPTD